MTGVYGAHGEDAAAQTTSEFLEALALNQDRERWSVLAHVARLPVPGPDPLSACKASIDADKALEEGLFAPKAEPAKCVPLRSGAYPSSTAIGVSNLDRRPGLDCRAVRGGRRAGTGVAGVSAPARERRLSRAPVRRHLSASAYVTLPPKPDGERPIPRPAVAVELADLPCPRAALRGGRTCRW